jgi:actin-like ATPase involved in cell morphogenesis
MASDLVAGGATANLVITLEDGADHEAVGVAGDRLLEREVEAVADKQVVTIDEREGAAGDIARDGIPRVALGRCFHLRSWVAT